MYMEKLDRLRDDVFGAKETGQETDSMIDTATKRQTTDNPNYKGELEIKIKQ